MRSSILFFSLIIFGLSSKNSYSQNAIIDVESNVSINVEDIFELIRSHTNYQFIYKYNLIKDAPKVTIEKGIIKVKDLLKKGLDGISCTYDFDDDQTIVVRKKRKTKELTKTITGRITNLNVAIPDVNIFIKGKQKGTKTNIKGYYKIETQIGDIIQYSHIGYAPIAIIVEDVTNVLNLELSSQTNILDEVTVVAEKPVKPKIGVSDKLHQVIETAVGKINPMLLPSKVHYFEGKDIGQHYSSLTEALKGKISGGIPQIFDVDGVIYRDDAFIPLSRIIDLYVVTGSAGTARWGGSVVIVRTLDSPTEIEKRREEKAEKYRNQNYYKDDAVVITKTEPLYSDGNTQQNSLRIIKGQITYLEAPLSDVNIIIKGRTRGAKTDTKGNYELQAKTGEIIQYSYIGFKSISIIIEDITKEINIEMITQVNQLDEVVVMVTTIDGEVLKRSKKADRKFSTSRGNIDPKTAGYAVGFVDGDEISNTYQSLKEALVGKISGFRVDLTSGKAYLRGGNSTSQDYPVAWEVDGVFSSEEPTLDLSQIEDVFALKSLAATNKYGTLGTGGVIVINTKYGNFNSNDINKQKAINKYANKNFYNNDAKRLNLEFFPANSYTELLESFNDLQEAYSYYNNELKYSIDDVHIDLSIAQKFISFYKNRNLGVQILRDLAKKYRSNPEYLKAIAYQMQLIKAHNEAVKVYQEIYKLRPKYAQSYRDLANAYHENDQFKKSWRMYMNYLIQGNDATNEGIGTIIYNEMEYLYFNRKNQTKIKEKFVPKNETLKDFRNDVRMTFEWNTSEAEFDLEFVGPDKRSYVFEHSLNANENLIIDEKTKGYSSKEFIIEDVGDGEWLVNITYYGNKKPEPSYFKFTTYYHWGKPNQKKKTQVYRLKNERDKIQLIKIDKAILIASK